MTGFFIADLSWPGGGTPDFAKQQSLALAKESSVDVNQALALVNWENT